MKKPEFQTAHASHSFRIPAGYTSLHSSFPEHPDVELFLLPQRRLVIFNDSARSDANLIRMVFR